MIIADYGMVDANSVATPLTTALLSPSTGGKMIPEDATKYRAASARLNYLAQDRPDLAVAACVAAGRMADPRVGDEMLMKRIARYLVGCSVPEIKFRWQTRDGNQLTLYTDSDWATCPATRRSRSGGALFRGEHCVMHWCKTQDRVARSSGEAELKSACKGVSEMLGLQQVLAFILNSAVPLTHCLDASATVGMVHRQGAGQLKHLDVRTLWIQEAVLDSKINVTKIPRAENWADALCSVPQPSSWTTTMANLSLELFPLPSKGGVPNAAESG